MKCRQKYVSPCQQVLFAEDGALHAGERVLVFPQLHTSANFPSLVNLFISMQRRHWLIQPSYESSALQSGLVLFRLNSLSDFTHNLRTSWASRFWSLIKADWLVKYHHTSSLMLCLIASLDIKSFFLLELLLQNYILMVYGSINMDKFNFKCVIQKGDITCKICVFEVVFPI